MAPLHSPARLEKPWLQHDLPREIQDLLLAQPRLELARNVEDVNAFCCEAIFFCAACPASTVIVSRGAIDGWRAERLTHVCIGRARAIAAVRKAWLTIGLRIWCQYAVVELSELGSGVLMRDRQRCGGMA